ncbi:winged helix-turn-helix domain-containing protein [Caldalkalibacillus mannanilyticus]|uniref:winged helix-turn-helix domain-containing protein n=1 Tax=Caldalkalibacillus mannanilyticus TaxID=1418 RepID=UPI00046A3235|nr:winged helix-turn-helix domain-containing protein [Caldalkalibacillus mannanilyticus]
MTYKLVVDYSPVYELISSFTLFSSKKFIRNTDLGSEWVQKVKKQLDPEFLSLIANPKTVPCLEKPYILAWKSPYKQDIQKFLWWLGELTPGDMYEMLAPFVTEGLPNDLGDVRDKYVQLFSAWYEQYYSKVEEHIGKALEQDAEYKKRLEGSLNAVDLLEQASGGVRIEPLEGLDLIVLSPSSHYAPLTVYCEFQHFYFVQYSIDIPHEDPEAPQKPLMRITRALADENRMKILKFLAQGPKTFKEIVKFTRLSKSTVHHHLMALRSSGLISVYVTQDSNVDRYRFRPNAFKEFNKLMSTFLDAGIEHIG